MTISILGRCDKTGMLGMVIASSSIAVASRCAFARAGVGVVATQNMTDPRLGPKGLAFLERGLDPETALATLLSEAEHGAFRQIAILDVDGRSACFSGDKALGVYGAVSGKDCVASGNLLANTNVVKVMADSFGNIEGGLASRLISSLEAGLVAGGEAGPVHSAGLIVAHVQPWPFIDLRIDWAESGPVAKLRQLWQAYEPQAEDYVTRAIDPQQAPAFGVSGNPDPDNR